MEQFWKQKKSGQITLLAILLGVLGLTVGLSVASRSLSDLKQASYVDFGTKALAAAEAGAEYGLYYLSQQNPLPSSCLNGLDAKAQTSDASWNTLNIKSISVDVCPDLNKFVTKDVLPEDIMQVNMANSNSNNQYYVLWNNVPSAIEITTIYSNFTVRRFAYNGAATGAPWNSDNFVSAGSPTGVSNCQGGLNYQSAGIPAVLGAEYVQQIRVKPLGGAGLATVSVCGDGNGISPQSYVVTATAVTNNDVTKKIQVTKDAYGTLPAVFDNVIYSGGSLTKN